MPGGYYAMTSALAEKVQKIPLTVQVQNEQGLLYWYLDDSLVGQARADQTLYIRPQAGRHHLSVFDARGHFDTVDFLVHRGRS